MILKASFLHFKPAIQCEKWCIIINHFENGKWSFIKHSSTAKGYGLSPILSLHCIPFPIDSGFFIWNFLRFLKSILLFSYSSERNDAVKKGVQTAVPSTTGKFPVLVGTGRGPQGEDTWHVLMLTMQQARLRHRIFGRAMRDWQQWAILNTQRTWRSRKFYNIYVRRHLPA